MGRERGKPAGNATKPKSADKDSNSKGGVSFAVKCGGLLALVASGSAAAFFSWRQQLVSEQSGSKGSSGLGPAVMSGQTSFLDRLLQLTVEVEEKKGDENRTARIEAMQKVEAELKEIEKQVDPSTPAGKQQVALIELVRSAFESDKTGTNLEWNDEELLNQHGLVTYATSEYWEEAYAGKRYGVNFDWYAAWAEPTLDGYTLGEKMRPLLSKNAKILMLGAGNSNMSALMYNEGFKSITNIDIAQAVIDEMSQRHNDLTEMTWLQMDGSKMTFADASFDAVIEKGMFDALYAGTGEKVKGVLKEANRVLKRGGQFFSVTYSSKRVTELFEKPQAEGEPASLSCRTEAALNFAEATNEKAEDKKNFFLYVCNRL